MSTRLQTVAVDFDGVIHSYTSGWHGTTTIADPPVPGAVEWLSAAVLKFRVIIHTSRLAFDEGDEYHEATPISERIAAIKRWMRLHGVPGSVVGLLLWHTGPGKPHAHIYIDDRGYRFEGTFPPLDSLAGMVPWNRKTGGQGGHVKLQIITGFPSDVPAAELRDLANARAEYHEEKAGEYNRQVRQLRQVRSDEPAQRGSRDAVGDLEKSVVDHSGKATVLRFKAKHVVDGAVYRLGREDLALLGIQPRGY